MGGEMIKKSKILEILRAKENTLGESYTIRFAISKDISKYMLYSLIEDGEFEEFIQHFLTELKYDVCHKIDNMIFEIIKLEY